MKGVQTMYEDFLKDVLEDATSKEIEEGYSLSKLIFMSWISKKLKENEQEQFEEQLTNTLENLGKFDLVEDDDINDLLFLFGYKMREDLRLEGVGFNNRLAQHYGLEFYYLELLEILSRELGELFSKKINDNQEKALADFLFHQHIRACSIYSEIIYLIKGGFGTGAITRFRSLHELAVISEFVVQNGEEAAESYFDYLPVMQMKDLMFQERLVGESLDDETVKKELRVHLREITEKRGKDFTNLKERSDYIWAKKYLKNGQNASFNQIRKSINRQHGLKPYKIASNNIHSAPKSIVSSLSTSSGAFGSGASNIGISLAGTWGTYEMIQMNRLVFSQLIQEKESEIVEQMQGMFIMKMMGHLSKLLYENFPDKEDQLLADDEQ
ncbi:hypothetical protein OA45_01792 [Bacillus sp. UMTAT18]|nr:hypothetical protein OA45_01792 [Bacillus sp. UMTAT18]